MDAPHAETRALITGGSQGLGLAIARQLIAEGCPGVVIAGRDAAKGAAAAGTLSQEGCEVHFLQTDLADVQAAIAMVDRAAERLGRVTALVNSAADTARGSILDTTPALWDRIVNTNARGPFFALQRFAQRAIEAGHEAAAVNILSVVVHGGLPYLAPYAASKAALVNITMNAAAALSAHRIRVNGINVGWMDTPGEDAIQKRFHDRLDGWQAAAGKNLPFGRLLAPEEVAWQASFLAGPRSGVVTGSVMDFDQRVIGAYPDTNHI